MSIKKKSKEKKSKSALKSKIPLKWNNYKYATAQLIFSNKPIKNTLKTALAYGASVSVVDIHSLWFLEGKLYKTIQKLTVKEN